MTHLNATRAWLRVIALLGTITLAILLAGPGAARTTGPTFAPPVYVDQQLPGGEPEVVADTLHGTLVYTSHEGRPISTETGS